MSHPYAHLMPCKDKNVNVCIGEGCFAEACVGLALRKDGQEYDNYVIPVEKPVINIPVSNFLVIIMVSLLAWLVIALWVGLVVVYGFNVVFFTALAFFAISLIAYFRRNK